MNTEVEYTEADRHDAEIANLRASIARDLAYAAEYDRMASILLLADVGHTACRDEQVRMRRSAEHHRGWVQNWTERLRKLDIPMLDKSCGQPAQVYSHHGQCLTCGFPDSCHEY